MKPVITPIVRFHTKIKQVSTVQENATKNLGNSKNRFVRNVNNLLQEIEKLGTVVESGILKM